MQADGAETRRLLVTLAEAADVQGFRETSSGRAHQPHREPRGLACSHPRAEGCELHHGRAGCDGGCAFRREACFTFARDVRMGAIAGTGGRFHRCREYRHWRFGFGPVMAVEALRPFHEARACISCRMLMARNLADVLKGLGPRADADPRRVQDLTTVETMTNARSARAWLAKALGEKGGIRSFRCRFDCAREVEAFGISASRMFGFWIGWAGAILCGHPLSATDDRHRSGAFRGIPRGRPCDGSAFSRGFTGTETAELLGLIGIWHRNVCAMRAVRSFPMPSASRAFPLSPAARHGIERQARHARGRAGHHRDRPDRRGRTGTNGQHAFFQLIHQGTLIIPVEFLLGAKGEDDPALAAHQPLLVANCLAQSQALMRGRSLEEAGGNPHRVFPGRPALITQLYCSELDAFVLGQLLSAL